MNVELSIFVCFSIQILIYCHRSFELDWTVDVPMFVSKFWDLSWIPCHFYFNFTRCFQPIVFCLFVIPCLIRQLKEWIFNVISIPICVLFKELNVMTQPVICKKSWSSYSILRVKSTCSLFFSRDKITDKVDKDILLAKIWSSVPYCVMATFQITFRANSSKTGG